MPAADHLRLEVRLTPRASCDLIEGEKLLSDGRRVLAARVRAVPEKGAANEALLGSSPSPAAWREAASSSSRVTARGSNRSASKAILKGLPPRSAAPRDFTTEKGNRMSARVIDGKAIAEALRAKVAARVAALKERHGMTPGLAVVLVGDDPASRVYVANKARQTVEAGMRSFEHKLPRRDEREGSPRARRASQCR